MKILIYGTGGVGGYFGSRLEEAGHDVTFVARGKHLAAMRKEGLRLKSIDGDFIIQPVQCTSDISILKPEFDVIILGVKSWQIEDVAKKIKPLLAENTVVLPLQNGVNNVEKLLKILPKKNILAGFCKIYAKVEDYGVINHFGHPPELQLGELDNSKSERILKIKTAFDKAKFTTTIPDDIFVNIWKKFIFICGVSGLGALTRVSIGAMYENERTKALLTGVIQEIYDVAVTKGINFPDDMVQQTLNFIENQPYKSTASTQRDIMAGLPSELDNFNGYIVEQGKVLGVKTTINNFIYSCLDPLEQRARG